MTTLVFDFGNVLGHFSHQKSAAQVAALAGANTAIVLAELYGGQLERDFDSGRLTDAEYRCLVRQRFNLTCDDETFDRALGDMFEPIAPVCALVPSLARHCQLVLLSNTNGIHARHFQIQFAETLASFHHLILSHEVGLRKPSPEIYRLCERRAGARAEQCVFIDDLLPNVDAARQCGWRGIVYDSGVDLAAELARLGIAVSP